MRPEVVFIMGPTASGKTDLAMQLYNQRPCELISVDSALVYQSMDIGTAKPTPEELQKYPHQLINICRPDEPYSASRFRIDALSCIEATIKEKRLPVLVGGTMLYFKTLMQGIADLPAADDAIRDEINHQAQIKGWPGMHEELATFDPESAQRIKPRDSQRIQRAIEVYRLTGKNLTQFYEEQQDTRLNYHVLNIAIAPPDRAILRQRIRDRFLYMLQSGFIDEVRYLLFDMAFDPDLPAMRSVGYRQVVEHLLGHYDYETMIEKAVVATSRLAKRQLTWLRSWPDVHWLQSSDETNLEQIVCLLKSHC